MARLSSYKLKPEIHEKLANLFLEVLSATNKTDSGRLFINNLLSTSEQLMLAKRVGVAILVKRGYSYEAIKDVLKVSQGTVAKVTDILARAPKVSHRILERIIIEKQVAETLGKIEYHLSELLPPKGGDWSAWRRGLESERRKSDLPI